MPKMALALNPSGSPTESGPPGRTDSTCPYPMNTAVQLYLATSRPLVFPGLASSGEEVTFSPWVSRLAIANLVDPGPHTDAERTAPPLFAQGSTTTTKLRALATILGLETRTGTCMASGVRTTRKFPVGSAADLADSPTRSTQAYVGKKSKQIVTNYDV
uniref:Uncharacterized protein n=1 Tax=Ananas comosus var. bracteatus TaxID=296719 RepID=A0A6V7NTU5_ANACO|nr:unnamed protein product [Ananas comosus var. bracteatus]